MDFVEVQGSGEESVFSRDQLDSMLAAARIGIDQLFSLQKTFLSQP